MQETYDDIASVPRTKHQPTPSKMRRERKTAPCTSEIEYDDDELELLKAMDDFKKQANVVFPTVCDIRREMLKLGYKKQ